MAKKIILCILIFVNASCLYAEFTAIATKRLEYGISCIEARIEDQNFLLVVDTGSASSISLNQRLTSGLKLIPTGNSHSFSRADGTVFHSPEIMIPQLILGDCYYENVIGREDGGWQDEGTFKKEGLIGKAFLQNHHALFDFGSDLLILSDSEKGIEEAGFHFENWIQIPFSMTPVGILLSVEVEGTPAQFVLDSGSSHTVIKKSFLNVHSLKKDPSIGILGISLKNVIALDLAEPVEVDGFIGVELFLNHKIYLNFKKNVMFLEK